MNIAVLSDIHGNYIALKKCIDYAVSRNIRTFIFLGDYVGELAYPNKTMQIIYAMSTKYECYFIRGNKEDYWIDYQNSGECGWQDKDSTTGSLLYTYKHLSKEDIDFFKGLPISQKITIRDMPQITICHGSPYKVNQKLLPNNDKTYEIMESLNSSIILCGHTHIQSKTENNGKMVLNAGAVGVPLYSNGKSQFIILHEVDKQWQEEFVSLEYNVEKVIEELHISGLNKRALYWCIVTENLLRNGNISHGTVLAKAMSLCNDEAGNCIWPDIPEKYWKKAVAEIICR
ncbi:metallophosphoesterase family protein [Niameybacter massiliensis]|uniref:metallophosphoesterase family protein n=1 Tax=Niameybacter massiliensis TaxID=1658108 RepID=UPI0006B461EB|nr:metallophosphoesterase family protein [Niameybacter massiliensis]